MSFVLQVGRRLERGGNFPHPAFPFEESIEMILEGKGTQFDPLIIEVFKNAIPQFRSMYESFRVQMPEVY